MCSAFVMRNDVITERDMRSSIYPGGDSLDAHLTVTVNCEEQVRVWISSDGLPPKHRARLIRLRVMNPRSRITLIVSRQSLTKAADESLDAFATKLNIEIQDISAIQHVDSDERLILEHIHAEITAFFSAPKEAKGNLSVVSDYVRLLDFVLQRGLCTDMDVEFLEPLSQLVTKVPCPLGVLARFKCNGCVSNDATAGIAQSMPFRLARSNVATLIRKYREAVCRYFVEDGIDENADVDTVSSHPRFFELRNKQHDDALTGTARFSLAGGPDNFAISLHQSGIFCGYESDVTRGLEVGELTFDHVPHVLTESPTNHAGLCYQPFRFGPTTSVHQQTLQREQLWPHSLPNIVSHWDHSWIIDCQQWQAPTYREELLLAFFDGPNWSLEQATSLVRESQMTLCPARPVLPSLIETLIRPAPRQTPPTVTLEKMTAADQAFVLERETPSDEFRQELESRLDYAGSRQLSRQFVDTGIVAVHGLIDDDTLQQLRAAFEIEIAKKQSDNALQQISFNLCVDECEPRTLELFRNVASCPRLIDIVSYYLGGRSKFVSARGYRQGPCKPLRYRAWDYHQDMKTKGPFGEVKVMLLLTDVPHDGQAMRFACGSQSFHWDCKTQQQTRFTFDEALDFGQKGLFVCHGSAGTCILFDTNGIHSGHRNLSVTRDIITMNFTRDGPSAFCMFNDPVLTQQTSQAAPLPVPVGNLEWRSSVANGDELAGIREEYYRTPDLEDTKPLWRGDALQLVDVVVADLNVDLDLRLSPLFENDRSRDISLVAIRDAPLHDVQYADLLCHLDVLDSDVIRCVLRHDDAATERLFERCRCLWQCAAPLAPMVAIAEVAHHSLSTRLAGDASANCAALLRDLKEAIVRCDSMQRLRTTTIFLYFATAWAHRLLVAAKLGNIDVGCREILHFYVHLVAWEDMQKSPERDNPNE